MMHYRHFFDAAGHGTFFFGRIREGENEAPPDLFTWIYDCGSLRKSHLKGIVQNFTRCSHGKRVIDLVCLSHFDSDHVSGLDLILENFTIDTLVLPYVPLDVRLRLASEMSEELPGAGDHAAYVLDPVFYLERKDFGGRVSRIAIIRGRRFEDNSAEQLETPRDAPEGDRPPSGNGGTLSSPAGRTLGAQDGYTIGSGSLSRKVFIYDDRHPWLVKNLYEFLFYSKEWPNERAPRSGAPIADIAEQARDIIAEYHLTGRGTPNPGWLQELKNLYDTHFGSGYKQRNEISLCVFAGVHDERALEPCNLFSRNEQATFDFASKAYARRGVLLTGDAYLNPTELKNLLLHLGNRRSKLAVMQIPHHGSNNNWSTGNAALCDAEYYVICAPGTPKHPGTIVKRDLPGYILADYDTSVSFDYHESRKS